MTSRFSRAKDRLQGDIVNVVAVLFGQNADGKKKKRHRWPVKNPWKHGSTAGEFSIFLTGQRAGGFIDFTTGEKGDAIDLVAFALEKHVSADSRMRAVEWAEDRYGLKRMDPETREKLDREAAARRVQYAAEAAESQHAQRERCRTMFFASSAGLAGTPVDAYLASRGVGLADVPNLAPAFRLRPDCEYWPLAERGDEGDRLSPGPSFPALVSAMVSAGGQLNALHLTFLAPDGRGKAPVRRLAHERGLDPDEFNEKLFKGDVAGFVVRATNGPSGLSAEKAAAAGVAGLCGVTEGIEDALSAALACPELRMWAAGSLSSLLHVPDHPCVSGWIVFRDNDWGKPQAAALFRRAMKRLRAFGKPVEEVSMPADWGKDVNDALNGPDGGSRRETATEGDE